MKVWVREKWNEPGYRYELESVHATEEAAWRGITAPEIPDYTVTDYEVEGTA